MGGNALTRDPDGHKGGQKAMPLYSGIAGAVSGAVSRFVVGPLDVMKIRFQVQLEPIRETRRNNTNHRQLQSKYTSLRQAFKTILKEEGVLGLWRGTGAWMPLYITIHA